jgi:uncharacterized membrane protein
MREFIKAVLYETTILFISALAVIALLTIGLWKPWLMIVALCTWAVGWIIEQLFLEEENRR